jgi:hypothetical protein
MFGNQKRNSQNVSLKFKIITLICDLSQQNKNEQNGLLEHSLRTSLRSGPDCFREKRLQWAFHKHKKTLEGLSDYLFEAFYSFGQIRIVSVEKSSCMMIESYRQ